MGTVRIRRATPADLAAVQRIYRASALSNDGDRALMLSHPEVLVFAPDAVLEGRTRIAIDPGGTILGFASTGARATTGDPQAVELEDLFVDPQYMRRGVGRGLVEDIVGRARAAGAGGIEVTANPHAMAFYDSVGFVPAGVVQTRFGPAPRMRLDIR
ncbi:MAG: hypothetical protein QOI35_973 [Cryptosporangiaceae bacterium]|jgi:GNAT superfamily N-acetyltransferase|nr:hypothetical protein [Cryptosporangiaceae bacterium]